MICPCAMSPEVVACSSLIAQGYCMESWLDLFWDCWESNQSPRRFKGRDLLDFLPPTTPVEIRTTLRGRRQLQVVHGILYGDTVIATEHIESISAYLEKSQDSRAVWWSSSDGGHYHSYLSSSDLLWWKCRSYFSRLGLLCVFCLLEIILSGRTIRVLHKKCMQGLLHGLTVL